MSAAVEMSFVSSLSFLPFFKGIYISTTMLKQKAFLSYDNGLTTRSNCTMMSPQRRQENMEGEIFVDSSCIDCDTCRWMCPSVFHETNGKSAVHKQPITDEQILNALQAAVACPTGSIRTENKNSLASKASNSFPLPALDFHGKPVPNIYFNGFTSPHTFGALSWLLHTPKLTIMIDCPRFSTFLSRQIGHVDYLILTHRDDVHNHDKWASALNAKRIIRIDECNSMQKTDECEIKLRDVDFPFEITEGVTLIHVPGHTKGSISLIDEYSNSLFSGDHVFGSLDENITASKVYCSYSWDEQLRSVHSLSQFDIHHIWPGHGRPLHFECIEDAKQGFKKASIQLST